MAGEKATPADKAADKAADSSEKELAAVLADDPESQEEAFADAFTEFASKDDTVKDAPLEKPGDEAEPTGADAPGTTDAPDDPSGADKAAAEAAAETPDIWATATPEQKAAHEAVLHENKSNKGRLSALDRQRAADALQASRTTAVAAAAAETPAQKEATAKAAESWEQFKTEYPEVAGPMEQRFENRLTKLEAENATLREQVTVINDSKVQETIDTEEALLTERHPDWLAVTSTPEFAAWLPNQPRYVQEGFARNGSEIVDGEEAASLLDTYKGPAASTEPPKGGDLAPTGNGSNALDSRRARRLESAVTTKGGQAGPGAGPPEGDFEAAFDHFANKA